MMVLFREVSSPEDILRTRYNQRVNSTSNDKLESISERNKKNIYDLYSDTNNSPKRTKKETGEGFNESKSSQINRISFHGSRFNGFEEVGNISIQNHSSTKTVSNKRDSEISSPILPKKNASKLSNSSKLPPLIRLSNTERDKSNENETLGFSSRIQPLENASSRQQRDSLYSRNLVSSRRNQNFHLNLVPNEIDLPTLDQASGRDLEKTSNDMQNSARKDYKMFPTSPRNIRYTITSRDLPNRSQLYESIQSRNSNFSTFNSKNYQHVKNGKYPKNALIDIQDSRRHELVSSAKFTNSKSQNLLPVSQTLEKNKGLLKSYEMRINRMRQQLDEMSD